MAIQMPDFAGLFAKPDMGDLRGLGDAVQQYYAGRSAEMGSQFAPEQHSADIGLKGFQAQKEGAQTQKASQEARNLARHQQILDHLLSKAGVVPSGQQPPAGGAASQASNVPTAPTLQGEAGFPGGQGAPSQGQQPGGVDPFTEAVLAQMLGIDQLKPQVTSDNELVQPSYFGEPTRTRIGPSEEEREKTKARIETNKDSIKKNRDALSKNFDTDATWDALGNLIKNNRDELKDIVGPIRSKTFTLGKQKREIEGQLDSLLGRINLDTGQDIKGTNVNKAQELINQFKPSKSDRYDVFEGKYKAAQMIQRAMNERRRLYNKYMEDFGMSDYEAGQRAEQETDLDEVKQQIEQEYGEKVYFTGKNGKIYEFSIFDPELKDARADKDLKEINL